MSNQSKSEKVGKLVGIDLGTTNTVVAYMKGANPEVLFNRDGKPLTRSVVGLRKQHKPGKEGNTQTLIGNSAVLNLPMAPKDTIVSIKRLMGIGYSNPEAQNVKKNFRYEIVKPSGGTEDSVRVVMGGKEYAPEDISAMILRQVKEDAEKVLNEEVTHAVITVPAYFDQSQKAATLRAGVKAGLKVLKLLDEPTAAAITYGMDDSDSDEVRRVVVYDLGGGTFDVSVLMWGGFAFVPLDTEGDMWLGGDNFDQEIINYVVEQVKDEYGIDPTTNDRFMGTLQLRAQAVKESLSNQDSSEIIIPNLLQDESGFPVDVFIDITREEYEAMIEPYVNRSLELVDKALENAALTIDDIDYVLLAGNSSLTPLVQERVKAKFGKERVLMRKHPKHCVAEGAAIIAKVYNSVMCPSCGYANDLDAEKCAKCKTILNKLTCPNCGALNEPGAMVCSECDQPIDSESIQVRGPDPGYSISSRYYGIQYHGDEFAIFVEKNEPIPTPSQNRISQRFPTLNPNQRMIYAPVYGGEHTDHASKNTKQGEAFAILPPGLPQGTEVVISLWLNSNEIFELSAELTDGTNLEPWIIKGEADAVAIKSLEELDSEIRARQDLMSEPEKKIVEDFRDKAFKHLKSGQYKAASQDVEDLKLFLESIKGPSISDDDGGGGGGEPPAEDKANTLLRFSEFIIEEYGWLIGAAKINQLQSLMKSTESALSSGNPRELQTAVTTLEDELNNLPQVLQILLGLKMAIVQRIEPVFPTKALQFKDDLAETERLLQRDPNAGMMKLLQVAKDISETIVPEPKPRPCPVEGCNGVIHPGAFKCTNGHPWTFGLDSSVKK